MADLKEVCLEYRKFDVEDQRGRSASFCETLKDLKRLHIALIAVILFLTCNIVYLQVQYHDLNNKFLQSERPEAQSLKSNPVPIPSIGVAETKTDGLGDNIDAIQVEALTLGIAVEDLNDKVKDVEGNLTDLVIRQSKLEEAVQNSKNDFQMVNETLSRLRTETFENVTKLVDDQTKSEQALQKQLSANQEVTSGIVQKTKMLESQTLNHVNEYKRFVETTNKTMTTFVAANSIIKQLQDSVSWMEVKVQQTANALTTTNAQVKNQFQKLQSGQTHLDNNLRYINSYFQREITGLNEKISKASKPMQTAREEYEKYIYSLRNLSNDAKALLNEMKASEDELKEEINQAKLVLQGEFVKNLSRQEANTEEFVKTLVKALNQNVRCGGTFIALSEVQEFRIGESGGSNTCVYTVSALFDKKIEYKLPYYLRTRSNSITVNDGREWTYRGEWSGQARTTKSNKLIITFNSSWFYSGNRNLYVSYKAV